MGRVVLPNYPHHVVQRGHNRQVVFASEEDFHRYIDDLRELKAIFDVRIYAYCLMTNHVLDYFSRQGRRLLAWGK